MTWWMMVLIITLPPVFWVGLILALLWVLDYVLGAEDRAWLKAHKGER